MQTRLVFAAALAAAGCGGGSVSDVPVIKSVSPAFGPLAGGTRITISGSGFLVDGATPDRVLFGTHESPQAGAVDDNTLEVELPPGDAAGDVPLVVFNRNGNVSSSGVFHYSSAPTITSVSPTSVLYSSTTTVITVNGTGFSDENAGVPQLLVDGTPAINVQVVNDTQLTFSALPGEILSTPTLDLTNERGEVTHEDAFKYVPSMSPTLLLFTKNSSSTFAVFYDPSTDASISVPLLDLTTSTSGFRAAYTDSNGDIWVQRGRFNGDGTFGKLDFAKQTLVDPVQLPSPRLKSVAKVGTTLFAFSRSPGFQFGTFDPTTQTFTSINATLPCCESALASDGTTTYVVNNNSVSTIDATGTRGTAHALTPAVAHIGAMAILGTTLYAKGGTQSCCGSSGSTNQVISVDPTTGATAILHTFNGLSISTMLVFNP